MQCTKHIPQQKQKQRAKDRFRTSNLVLSNALVVNRHGTSLPSPYHLPANPPVPLPSLHKTDPIATGISLDLECASSSVHTKERETPQRKRSIQRRLWRRQRITRFPSRPVPSRPLRLPRHGTKKKPHKKHGTMGRAFAKLAGASPPRPHPGPIFIHIFYTTSVRLLWKEI
jgi:hypothetical protein